MTAVDSPRAREVIERSAEPARARAVVARVVAAHPWVEAELDADELLLEGIVAVAVASHSLFAALERDPVAVTMLRGDMLRAAISPADVALEARGLTGGDDPVRALRRWKRQHVVRIAGRDLLEIAGLRDVGRELASLAQAALDVAVDVAAPAVPLAVVGMGKLGGEELNYSSDVDVLFVHDGDVGAAERAARDVLKTMSAPGTEGIVFRTDAALRPEGRAGALSRTIDSYAAYWEQWAQTWELQALIKARPVAGDRALGEAFVARAEPFVWPDFLDPNAVREVRAMKARTEDMLQRQGLADREVKRGYGGIRDIEFAAQLLQLVHGRHDRSIRSRTTLDALEQLARGGYVSPDDAGRLDAAYVWLRTVEHRLQLVDEHQTHTIPDDGEARTHLARVLGFRDRGDVSAIEAFDAMHQHHQTVVRRLHEELFFAPVLETLAGVGPLPAGALETRLAAFGFTDVEQTRAALHELTAGLTRRSRVMQQLLPAILEWLSVSPDPDLGLLQLRRLTEGYNRSSALARGFRESPAAAERACKILGSSRVLGLAFHRQPDFVDLLADTDALSEEPMRDALVAEALETLDWRDDEAGRRAGLRRFKRRQLLRIGTRDLLGFANLGEVGRELSNLADASIEAALRSLEPPVAFAVIGLGRLGGCELSYASDVDLVFVYDGLSARDFEAAEQIATRLVRALGEATAEGSTFRVDTRLRPEGRQGPLARSLEAFRAYYAGYGQTWEFQALTKARVVAGDDELGARFISLAHEFTYRDPFPEEWRREVRRMKARIERERVPPGEDPRFHLKLGRGSLSDIEFTVQLEQLAFGASNPEVRDPSTLRALSALVDADVVDEADAEHLAAAYVLCERARNYRYLLTGSPSDALPVDGDESEKLARMLGYEHRPQQQLRDDYRRLTRRARGVVERLFYGREQ